MKKNQKLFLGLLALLSCFSCYAYRSNKEDSIKLSTFKGSFNEFISSAIKENKVAIIDKDVTADQTVNIDGDIIVIGYDHPTITNSNKNLFLLKSGVHYFEGFNIDQSPNCTAFKTFVLSNIIWTNTIRFVDITGGSYGYYSDRGGVYDAAEDSVSQWSGTIIKDCVFKTNRVCVTVYSQDGAGKYLHMRNVDLYSDTSHNMYVHPNVSLQLYNVRSMKTGNTTLTHGAGSKGLALHHFSGGGNLKGRGAASNARYVEIKKCITMPGGGMWQIAEPVTGAVIMDSCDLAPYSIPQPYMMAKECRFQNIGGGAFVKGKIINCTGVIWPVDSTIVIGGSFDNVTLRSGKVKIEKTFIKYLSAGKEPTETTFKNCIIQTGALYDPIKSKIVLQGTKQPQWLYNRKPAKGLLIVQ